MPVSPEDLLAYLAALGIATETVDHPPLHTVEDSPALRGEIPGGHAKNLFVKDKKSRLFLLVLGEETEIDLKRVHERSARRGASPSARRSFWRRSGAFGRARSLPSARSTTWRAGFPSCSTQRCCGMIASIFILWSTPAPPGSSADLKKFLRATGHEPLVVALGQDRAARWNNLGKAAI